MKKLIYFIHILFFVLPFSLEALATVEGVITDSTTNLPISNVTVQAIRNNIVRGTATTNGSGFYTMDVLPGNNYTIVATASGYQNHAIGANLKNNQTTIVNLSLVPNGGTISGNVTNSATSNPISGATIEIFLESIFITSDTTDVNGDYSIADLVPGSYIVIASFSSFQTSSEGAIVTAGSTAIADFSLDPNPGTISGTVKEVSTLNPIEGAFVEVFKGSILVASTLTDPTGSYSIPNLTPDDYNVEVIATDYQSQFIGAIVTAGGTSIVNFELQLSPGTISGTVTDSATSNPIPSATIEVFKGSFLVASILTDTNGNYLISDLAPDDYDVEIKATNYQSQFIGAIVTAGGTTVVNIALDSNPGTISGTVTDSATSNPISGATIEVFKGPVLITFTLTDPSGSYSISGLAPDTYNVEVLATDYQDKFTSVAVTAGGTSIVNFELDTNPGTISGTVTDSATLNPISGAIVEVYKGSVLIAFVFTDPNGDYSISGLAPDTYNVEVLATDYQDKFTSVIVTAGVTSVVDFALDSNPGSISGNVNDTISNVSAALVEVFKGTTLVAFILTDMDGNYEITGLAPDNYDVIVIANKYENKTQSVSVTAGNTSTLNFVLVPQILPPSQIAGRDIKHVCLTQLDLIHVISWNASDSLYITQYRLSRNGLIIAAISSDTLQYFDHNRNSQTDTYTLVTINQLGQISAELTITIN